MDIDSFKIDDGLFEALWKGMSDGSLSFKGGNNIQTREDNKGRCVVRWVNASR